MTERRSRTARASAVGAITGVVALLATAGYVHSQASASPPAARPVKPAPRASADDPRAASAAPVVASYRIAKGAVVDLGWTGIAHEQAWPAGQRLDFELRCKPGEQTCATRAGAPKAPFGPPVPLSSGGIPVCVVNTLRDTITGTFDVANGCSELVMRLAARIVMAQDTARPCPVCANDPTARDGKKDGRCEGGASAGAACDAEGESRAFGWTSSDCQPTGAAIGTLPIDLDPLTTNVVATVASEKCADEHAIAKCFCAGQVSPNACNNGRCARETCTTGPHDGFCSKAPFRSCLPTNRERDCEGMFPGSGTCENRPRPCFSEQLNTAGVCDRVAPAFVANFCVPATTSAALNTSSGLPGPARLLLPLERIESPASSPSPEPAKPSTRS